MKIKTQGCFGDDAKGILLLQKIHFRRAFSKLKIGNSLKKSVKPFKRNHETLS